MKKKEDDVATCVLEVGTFKILKNNKLDGLKNSPQGFKDLTHEA
jgi:hypothetical protein